MLPDQGVNLWAPPGCAHVQQTFDLGKGLDDLAKAQVCRRGQNKRYHNQGTIFQSEMSPINVEFIYYKLTYKHDSRMLGSGDAMLVLMHVYLTTRRGSLGWGVGLGGTAPITHACVLIHAAFTFAALLPLLAERSLLLYLRNRPRALLIARN